MTRIKTAMLAKVIAAQNAKDDEGSVAAEYGLLIVGIALLIGVGAATLGGKIQTLFESINFPIPV